MKNYLKEKAAYGFAGSFGNIIFVSI